MHYFFNLLSGAILGSVFGSFFAAAARSSLTRTPFWRKRSVCDACGSTLPPWTLVPVFAYLFLKGRCRACNKKIPLYYLSMELLPAALATIFVWLHGLNYLVICHIILASAITAACLIDLLCRRLPDIITIGLLVLLPAELFLNPSLNLTDSIIGYLAGGGLPLILAQVFKLLRHKEGLGGGDVKLYALAGAFLGWKALPFLFLFSAVCGLLSFLLLAPILKKKIFSFQLPFGPCIGCIFILLLLFPLLPSCL